MFQHKSSNRVKSYHNSYTTRARDTNFNDDMGVQLARKQMQLLNPDYDELQENEDLQCEASSFLSIPRIFKTAYKNDCTSLLKSTGAAENSEFIESADSNQLEKQHAHITSSTTTLRLQLPVKEVERSKHLCWHHNYYNIDCRLPNVNIEHSSLLVRREKMPSGAAIDSSRLEKSMIRQRIESTIDLLLTSNNLYFPLVAQSNLDAIRRRELKLIRREEANKRLCNRKCIKDWKRNNEMKVKHARHCKRRRLDEPSEPVVRNNQYTLTGLPSATALFGRAERALLWGKAAEAPLLDFLIKFLNLRVQKVNMLFSAHINTSTPSEPPRISNPSMIGSLGSRDIVPIEPVKPSDLFYVSSRPDALLEDVLDGEPTSCLEMKYSYHGYLYGRPPIQDYLQCQMHMLASNCGTTLYVQ